MLKHKYMDVAYSICEYIGIMMTVRIVCRASYYAFGFIYNPMEALYSSNPSRRLSRIRERMQADKSSRVGWQSYFFSAKKVNINPKLNPNQQKNIYDNIISAV